MTTMILQTAGQMIGGAVGGPVGAMIGQTLGSLAGSAIDGALFGQTQKRVVEGPRLTEMQGLASTEGAPIPRIYGRARIGGQLIWATRFEEKVNVRVERHGSRRQGRARRGRGEDLRGYLFLFRQYSPIGLCEGEIAFVRRVWGRRA